MFFLIDYNYIYFILFIFIYYFGICLFVLFFIFNSLFWYLDLYKYIFVAHYFTPISERTTGVSNRKSTGRCAGTG